MPLRNPFARPSSQQSQTFSQTQTQAQQYAELYGRTSSSLEEPYDPYKAPPPPGSPVRQCTTQTIPNSSPIHFTQYSNSIDSDNNNNNNMTGPSTTQPITPKNPKKNPSILRSLAHHPSFSALKSKSRKKKERDGMIYEGGAEFEQVTNTRFVQNGQKGLRESLSEPGSMRMSEDRNSSIPPIPTHSLLKPSSSKRRKATPPLEHAEYPSLQHPNPTINIQHCEVPINNPIMTPAQSPSKSPSKLKSALFRSRSKSISSAMEPDSQLPSPVAWPPSPFQQRQNTSKIPSPPRLSAPPNMQTPFGRLQRLPSYELSSRSVLEGRSSGYREDNEKNLQQGSEQGESWVDYDGLDVFVTSTELPVGTPGGKKADLRRGAFVDGAKHSRGAIRVFSRDTYDDMPSRTSTDDGSSIHSTVQSTSHAKRSASPFEVKLTPVVSKRISLDAFGTPSLQQNEELLDDVTSSSREGSVHRLSIIPESPASHLNPRSHDDIDDEVHPFIRPYTVQDSRCSTPETAAVLRYYSSASPSPPGSPTPDSNNTSQVDHNNDSIGPTLPILSTRSPIKMGHSEIPPHQTTSAVWDSQEYLSDDSVQKHHEERKQIVLCLASSRVEVNKLRKMVSNHELTRSQLLTAVNENEIRFEVLQSGFDDAVRRIEELETVKSELGEIVEEHKVRESELVQKLEEVEKQLDITAEEYTSHLRNHQDELGSVLAQVMDYQLQLQHQNQMIETLRSEIAAAGQVQDELDAAAHRLEAIEGRHVGEMEELKKKIVARDATIAIHTDRNERLRGEVKKANLTTVEREATIDVLKDKLRDARFEANERRFEADTEIVKLKAELEGRDSEVAELEEEIKHLEHERTSRQGHYNASLSANEHEIARLREEIEAARRENKDRRDLTRSLDRAKEAENELRNQLEVRTRDVEAAMVKAEEQSTRADGLESRLAAYLMEIDRLKVSEASLKDQMNKLQKTSAMEELERVDLKKRVQQLETDKEMLNVALESKQMELTLAQRRAAPRPTPATPTTRSLNSSTSRIPQTPTNRSAPSEKLTSSTSRRLTSSVSASNLKAARRESSLLGDSPSTPRSTRTALGNTTHHNRTPEPQRQPGPVRKIPIVVNPAKDVTDKVVSRRSSLPVLVRKPSVIGKGRVEGTVIEENESG